MRKRGGKGEGVTSFRGGGRVYFWRKRKKRGRHSDLAARRGERREDYLSLLCDGGGGRNAHIWRRKEEGKGSIGILDRGNQKKKGGECFVREKKKSAGKEKRKKRIVEIHRAGKKNRLHEEEESVPAAIKKERGRKVNFCHLEKGEPYSLRNRRSRKERRKKLSPTEKRGNIPLPQKEVS